MNDFDSWLSKLNLLAESLGFLPPDLLPPSFREAIQAVLKDREMYFCELELQNEILQLLEKINTTLLLDQDRTWLFWESVSKNLALFARAEICSIFLLTGRETLTKIHPLGVEEENTKLEWLDETKAFISKVEPKFQQTLLVRLKTKPPLVLKFQSVSISPPIREDRLQALVRYNQVWLNFFRSRLPTPDHVTKLSTFSLPTEAERHGLLGRAPSFLNVIDSTKQAAHSDATVYFRGESGAGKELFARFLHAQSKRHDQPFIPINCSAIPHELIESEMFGHEKGAFTGAYYRKFGRIEQADGGTLFLDEIGEMPLPFQAKLLRFLQDKTFSRVGGSAEISADPRIVVATHRDLKEMVSQKTFRKDLFYRIHVIPITIPSLRERGGDIRHLSELFFKKFIAQRKKTVDPAVYDVLERYPFPGNVRELENIIQRAVVMCQKSHIALRDLPTEVLQSQTQDLSYQLHPFEKFDSLIPHDRETLKFLKKEIDRISFSYQRDLDRRFLLSLLTQSGGSARQAAELAGINRTLFYKLLKKAGLDINRFHD